MTGPRTPATATPFTLAACTRCSSELAETLMAPVRRTVRQCPYGILVLTQCLLGSLTCAGRHDGPGVMLLLQPCTPDRRPAAPARWLGPLRTRADSDAICTWLAAGDWYGDPPPAGLDVAADLPRAARLN